MEKCFKVKEGSRFHKECVTYHENKIKANDIYKEFKSMFGIEATEYLPEPNRIYIVPTENDLNKFNSVLKTPIGQGLKGFKKNSKPCKWWCEKMKEADIRDTSRPFVQFWFPHSYGRGTTRIFPIGNVWYGSYSTDGEITMPEELEEIKQSEFYKII